MRSGAVGAAAEVSLIFTEERRVGPTAVPVGLYQQPVAVPPLPPWEDHPALCAERRRCSLDYMWYEQRGRPAADTPTHCSRCEARRAARPPIQLRV